MDQHDMWKDTMLIVNTDHGYMLGEHGFFGKNYMPNYDQMFILRFLSGIQTLDAQGREETSFARQLTLRRPFWIISGLNQRRI